jgi:DNA invertase Pin-like site-specific DNA recombinase
MPASTENLALQLDALQPEGCDRMFQDRASGAQLEAEGAGRRPRCFALGDVLTVWKLDRLGRSLFDLVGLVEDLKAREIGLEVLTGAGASIDTTKPEGRLFFAMFAALAEFERELIRERTRAGMKAAKRRRVHVGRPSKLGPDQLEIAAQLMPEDRSQHVVASTLGAAASTLREAMKAKQGKTPLKVA